MTVADAVQRRRFVQRQRRAAATAAALSSAARDLRSRAQQQVDAGHPELAGPFLDEAELFESAASRPPGL